MNGGNSERIINSSVIKIFLGHPPIPCSVILHNTHCSLPPPIVVHCKKPIEVAKTLHRNYFSYDINGIFIVIKTI